MTWKVPGAEITLVEFPPTLGQPATYAVRLELTPHPVTNAIDWGSDTALALAAALVDCAHRCDERTAGDARVRARIARQELARVLGPEMQHRKPGGPVLGSVSSSVEATRNATDWSGYVGDLDG